VERSYPEKELLLYPQAISDLTSRFNGKRVTPFICANIEMLQER
jgi:hypothetical protein